MNMSESDPLQVIPVEAQARRDLWLIRMLLSIVVMLILTGTIAMMITHQKDFHVALVLAGLLVIAAGVFAFSIPFHSATSRPSMGWLVTITFLRISIAGIISFVLLAGLLILLLLSICFGGNLRVN